MVAECNTQYTPNKNILLIFNLSCACVFVYTHKYIHTLMCHRLAVCK